MTEEIFKSLNICVLTVSDSRTPETDKSGDFLADNIQKAGHNLFDRAICIDDRYQIRALISDWIADVGADVVILTGGTGVTGRDVSVEAITPLFDKTIEGFGELFRQVSYTEIGTSTIQSRAVAGLANKTYIFALPGSTGACRTAWDNILCQQLDNRHKPCNFSELIKRLGE